MIEQVPGWLIAVVITVALIVGVFCVLNSNLVWYRKQVFGVGGAVLTFCGLSLIGLSVWGNIEIEAGAFSFNARQSMLENPELAESVINEAIQRDPELGKQLISDIATKDAQYLTDRVISLAATNSRIDNSLSAQILVSQPTLRVDPEIRSRVLDKSEVLIDSELGQQLRAIRDQ